MKTLLLAVLAGTTVWPFMARGDQIHVSESGPNVVLTWTNPAATLETSLSLGGAWLGVEGATSPWVVAPTNAASFYRLRLPGSAGSAQYRINSSAGPSGAISPDASLLVTQGTYLTFSATPDPGYLVDLWYRNGVSAQTNGGTFTLANVQGNVDVFVTFRSTNGPAPGTNPPPIISPSGPPPPGPSGPGMSIGPTEGNLVEVYGPPATCACANTGGSDLTLNCSLIYNSADADGTWGQLDATLGFGWTHSFNVFLSSQRGQLFRYGPNGRAIKFTSQTNGTYLPPPGYFEIIVSNAPGSLTLTTKDGTAFTFTNVPGTPFAVGDAVYRLSQIADRNRNTTTLTYASGRLATVTDTYGRVLTFSNNASGHLASITDPLGRTTAFGYDASGAQLVSITDPQSNTVHYGYNPLHQLSQKVDKDGRLFAFIYQRGKPIAISDAQAKNLFTLSNPSNWATDPVALTNGLLSVYIPSTATKTDGAGNPWTYNYDTNAAITRMVAPDGSTTTYAYDSATRMIASVTDPNLHTTRYQYDSLGNRTNATDALNNVTSYAYEPVFSQMTRMVDPNGRVTTYQYDGRGNRTNVIDALGQTTSYTYNTNGNLLTMRDKRGYTTSYLYDSHGNRTNMIDALGDVTRVAYDAVGNRTNRVDANGHTNVYVYDKLDRLIQQVDPVGSITRYSYDGSGNRTNVLDRNNNSVTFVYDYRQRLVQTIDALGHTNSYAYDGNNNRTNATDANGHGTTYVYDVQNRLTTTIDAVGNSSTTVYDPAGNACTNINPRSFVTVFAYDALNRVVQRYDPATNSHGVQCVTTNAYAITGGAPCCSPTIGSSLLTEKVDAEGKVTYYKYDALDRLTAEVRKQGDTSDTITTNDAVTYYAYDASGNCIFVTNAIGNVTAYQYDSLNRQTNMTNAAGDVISTTYDAVGNISTVTAPNGNIRTNSYDARDRLIQVADKIGLVASYTYDPVGNRLTQTDGNTNTTMMVYDSVYRLIETVDALGQSTTNQYDAVGNLTNVVDRANNQVRYVYDAINRRTRVIDALGHTNTTVYDSANNVLELTDAQGGTTSYQYDGMNRRMEEMYPDGQPPRTFTYDGVGTLLSRTDQAGQTTHYVYDDLYRLIDRQYSNGDLDDQFTYDLTGRMLSATRGTWPETFAYDAADRLTNSTQNGKIISYLYNVTNRYVRMVYPDGRVVTNSTDFRGRLTLAGDTSVGGPWVQYTYDLADRVLTRTNQGGGRTVYTYNGNNWVTNLTHTLFATNFVAGFTYDYDHEGDKRYENNLSDTNRSEAYQYDRKYRLTNYSVGQLAGLSIVSPFTNKFYALDAEGNWNSIITVSAGMTNDEVRAHNAANQITSINSTNSLSYDRNGNLQEDGVYHYRYDSENRLVAVIRDADGVTVGQYQYDALGRRVIKLANPTNGTPVETDFYYDGARVIADGGTGSTIQATYLYGNGIDEVLSMTRGSVYYFYQNALGSVVAATLNNTTTVSERYRYDAYGQATITDGSGAGVSTNSWGTPHSVIGLPFLFTGRQLDEESGVYFYRARYYDPGKGRFLQRDPVEYVDGMNLYSYTKNNPVSYMDPDGKTPVWLAECGGGALIGGIGGCIGGLFSSWSFRGTACGGVGGAISGCCSAVLCLNVPTFCKLSCLCGVIGSFAETVCNGGFDFKDPCAWVGLFLGGGAGCLGGIPADGKAKLVQFLTGMTVGEYSNLCPAVRAVFK